MTVAPSGPTERPAPGVLARIRALAAVATAADGDAALEATDPASQGSIVLDAGVAAVVASPASQSWSLEAVVSPESRPDVDIGSLIDEMVTGAHQRRAVPIFVWRTASTAGWCDQQADAGRPVRTLLELRGPLPVSRGHEPEEPIAVRPFRPGPAGDEEAWVEINNRAFSWHPEQGGRTVADLRAHLTQPWVDLDGFLVHERDGVLAGFCWTKLHDGGRMGEIYVVGVDPSHQGHGLGRALTVAGFGWLHRHGATTGNLWVEGDNAPALRIYHDLGLAEHRRRLAVRVDPVR